MADIAKPVEVPETTPVVSSEPAVEAKPLDVAAADLKPTEEPIAETSAPAVVESSEETKKDEVNAVEETKEVKPVEEGHLEHKGSPANFPKNFIYSKQLFWFGSEPVTAEKLSAYVKAEKVTEVAHHVTSWASHTGEGLLFYGDKSKPTGVIQLAEASEPTTEGQNKFALTTKGHKHAFKASSPAERDNWVSQIKAKITEAKELAGTITESEAYKTTLESLKPKKEVAAEPVKESPVEQTKDVQETPVAAVQEPAVEPVKEEKKDELKPEEPTKRRSASRKRQSIFGNFLGKKEGQDSKKESSPEPTPVEPLAADVAPATEPVTETPAPLSTETPFVAPEATKEESVAEPLKDSKPVPTKRNSLFGNLSFSKKKPEAEVSKKEEAPLSPSEEIAPVAETAPVIPAVETTEPLSAEVASPATVPTETVDATPVVNGEEKKEKRKSSFFGKKEKVTSDEEGEKPEKSASAPFFSKLRQTVKGNKKSEKPTEATVAEDKPVESSTTPAVESTEAAKPIEETPVAPATTEEPKSTLPVATPVPAAA